MNCRVNVIHQYRELFMNHNILRENWFLNKWRSVTLISICMLLLYGIIIIIIIIINDNIHYMHYYTITCIICYCYTILIISILIVES